jgi:hypothetical protein
MRGARAEEVRSEGTEAEGADPRRPEWGSDLLGPSRQTHKQTNREVECRSGRALEILRARTTGQHRAQQAMECQNERVGTSLPSAIVTLNEGQSCNHEL